MSDPNAVIDAQRPDAAAAGESVGTLVVRDGGLAPSRQPLDHRSGPLAPGVGGDASAAGIDYVRALHAVRRRWLPASALGLLLAVTAEIGRAHV